jgi:glucosamine--fructose-6-phosphate aminotransferase (isomerizing)
MVRAEPVRHGASRPGGDDLARLESRLAFGIAVRRCDRFVAPPLDAIPIQLLAYHAAVIKTTDAEQPRNLAKSVAVE